MAAPTRQQTSARDTAQASEGAGLRRALGVSSATFIVVGGIIGSGIFFTPAEVARALPSGEWILLEWALGAIVALAGALTYAELGAMLPDAGGAYVYIREAFGSLWSFLYGWMILCSIATGALAAVAMGFGNSLGRLVPLDAVGGPITVAALTIIALTVTNYLGIRAGAIVTNVLTASKILLLAFIIGGGILLWSRVGAPLPVPNAPAPRASLLVALAAAFPPVLFTIGGWQQLNMVAGEIREPARTIPRALVAGILIVIACYLGANAVYLHALGRDGLAASPAVAADVATRFVGPMGARVIAVGVALSVLGFVNVVILSNSRIVYAMARDGLFVPSAGRVHPRFASPHVAIVLMGAIALGLLLFTKGNLGQLLAAVVFADWIFFGLGAASVFALRRKHPEWPRPYRVIGYPIVPAFFVLAAMIGVVSAFVAAFDVSVLGTALLLVGVGAFKYFERSRRASTGASSVER